MAGIHAREWISPATVTYIINELVENFNIYKHILDHIDIHFVPSINPDGYAYSHAEVRIYIKVIVFNGNLAIMIRFL